MLCGYGRSAWCGYPQLPTQFSTDIYTIVHSGSGSLSQVIPRFLHNLWKTAVYS